jgi:nicotinamide-nucleotide amidase
MNNLVEEIGTLLKLHKLTLGAVESATGGLISHLLTNESGCSEYYLGSITSYSNEVKMKLVGVKKETLDKYGAVSSKVAEEMAEGGRKTLGVDICIADTGIAGPTGATKSKPIGLFYLGLSHQNGTFNRKYIFHGTREQNKEQAAIFALTWVKEYLTEYKQNKDADSTFQTKHVVTSFLEFQKKILILRRSNKVGTYQSQWAGVSGYIEKSPDQQALIEIQEETGLSASDVELTRKGNTITARDDKLKRIWIIHPYLFRVLNPDKIKIDWEHTETKWITPEEIADYPTVPRLKVALDMVLLKQHGN